MPRKPKSSMLKYAPTTGPIVLSDAAARAGELVFGRPADVNDHRVKNARGKSQRETN